MLGIKYDSSPDQMIHRRRLKSDPMIHQTIAVRLTGRKFLATSWSSFLNKGQSVALRHGRCDPVFG